MLKQSFTWWSFAGPGTDPETLLRRAAEIGYDGVELLDEALFPLAKAMGLEIVTHRAHAHIEVGLNRLENHDAIVRETEDALKLAERWKIPNLICFSGNRNGQRNDEGAKVTAEGLRRLAPLAESAGVTLLLELLNSKVDHPDYQADRTAWGVSVTEMVGSANVKLLYDIYHMQIMEGDLIRTFRTHHGAFGHLHTAGNPGRHELNGTQEINYPAVFRAVAESGWSGFIGHEFIPTGDPEDGLRGAYSLVLQAERQAQGFRDRSFPEASVL
jgi:hydroxypyruvate isomerase